MTKLAAVIIEPRSILCMTQVIHDHMKMLPEGTDLFIYTSEENNFLLDMLNPKALIPINGKSTIYEYNTMLTHPGFWSQFCVEEYDRVLIFQLDSMLLKPGIEEFYPFDYVGAPWSWNTSYGGNGGLSLRNPQIMYEITLRYPWNGQINEDVWFCLHMNDFKIGKMAPPEVNSKFSVEAVYQLGTLGYHGIEKWLTPEECKVIRNQYKLEEAS